MDISQRISYLVLAAISFAAFLSAADANPVSSNVPVYTRYVRPLPYGGEEVVEVYSSKQLPPARLSDDELTAFLGRVWSEGTGSTTTARPDVIIKVENVTPTTSTTTTTTTPTTTVSSLDVHENTDGDADNEDDMKESNGSVEYHLDLGDTETQRSPAEEPTEKPEVVDDAEELNEDDDDDIYRDNNDNYEEVDNDNELDDDADIDPIRAAEGM